MTLSSEWRAFGPTDVLAPRAAQVSASDMGALAGAPRWESCCVPGVGGCEPLVMERGSSRGAARLVALGGGCDLRDPPCHNVASDLEVLSGRVAPGVPALDRGSGEVGMDALIPDLDSRESLSWGAAGGERASTSRRADPAEAALHPDYVRRVWHADPKARRLDERFSMSMATPPTGGWFHDAGERVFIKDEIAPSRTFALIAAGGEHLYLDDEGRPISYDFDPSASNLHPLDVEATKELERLDAGIESALNAATVDMAGGASSTGVRAWRKFCALFELRVLRPLDSMSSLRDKLAEERLVLRFIMWLVDSRDIKASSAANYLGSVQGWHLRQTGVKLAAGIRLARVAELVKGLRRLRGDPGRRVRQGVSPDVLRQQMDKLLDPATMDGANMRAALSLGFQGLLRGAEFTVRQRKWDPMKDMSRADVAELSDERAVIMMLPCKNMQHMNGKTVPLVVGGGGAFIDAPAELLNLRRVDPVAAAEQSSTPLFRNSDGSAITEGQVRQTIKLLMADVGAAAADFGAHSLRIGGATALYKAGASHIDIMTMGRWSSDCYRLYVRACLGHSVHWSRLAASTAVDYTAEVDEYRQVDCF